MIKENSERLKTIYKGPMTTIIFLMELLKKNQCKLQVFLVSVWFTDNYVTGLHIKKITSSVNKYLN